MGIGRQLIEEYNNNILSITDLTLLTCKIYDLKQQGKLLNAKKLLPSEKLYPVATDVSKTLGIVFWFFKFVKAMLY